MSGEDGAGIWKIDLAARPNAAVSTEMCACSACAGEYENPDRTAWPTEEEMAEAADELPERVPEGEV